MGGGHRSSTLRMAVSMERLSYRQIKRSQGALERLPTNHGEGVLGWIPLSIPRIVRTADLSKHSSDGSWPRREGGCSLFVEVRLHGAVHGRCLSCAS